MNNRWFLLNLRDLPHDNLRNLTSFAPRKIEVALDLLQVKDRYLDPQVDNRFLGQQMVNSV